MIRNFISWLVLLVILFFIGFYLWDNREILQSLKNITFISFLILILLRVAIIALNGLFLKMFARKFGVRLRTSEWFGLSAITTMGNYITPLSGGLVARAAYLKHRHRLPYTKFVTLLTSNYIAMFWLIGMAGLLTLGWLRLFEFHKWPIILLFSAIVVGTSSLVLLPPLFFESKNRWFRRLHELMNGWQQIWRDRNLIFKITVCTILVVIINGLSFWVGYRAIGAQISFPVGFLFGLIAAFSIFINITPGSLGIQEAMISLSSELLGTGAGQGLLVVLLIRAATIALVFTLGPFFTMWLTTQVQGVKSESKAGFD